MPLRASVALCHSTLLCAAPSLQFLRNELVVCFTFSRMWSFYLYNIFLLVAMITSCTTAVWVVGPATPNRLSLDVSLLLVAVANKQVISTKLPPVSYLTILDWYALVCIAHPTRIRPEPDIRTRHGASMRRMCCSLHRRQSCSSD